MLTQRQEFLFFLEGKIGQNQSVDVHFGAGGNEAFRAVGKDHVGVCHKHHGDGNVTAQGAVSLDLTGKKPGRGAYVCKSAECFQKARKARRFERSLSCKIPEEVYESMSAELQEI